MMRVVVLLVFTLSPCFVYAREQHVLRAGLVSDPDPTMADPNPTTTETTSTTGCTYLDVDHVTEKYDGVCTSFDDCPSERAVGWGWYVIESSSLNLFFV